MNIKHSKGDPNWCTPGAGQKVDYVGRIRECLGGVIDLDPYSSDTANTIVGARRYYTPKDDGHAKPWDSDAVMINHPGGHTVRAWAKLCQEVHAGRARAVVWVGFSVEQINLLSEPCDLDEEDRFREGRYHPLDFSVLFTRNRIDFLKEDYWCTGCQELPDVKSGECGCGVAYSPPELPTLRKGGRPSHANYLVGIGVPHAKFCEVFGDLGHIIAGPLAQAE